MSVQCQVFKFMRLENADMVRRTCPLWPGLICTSGSSRPCHLQRSRLALSAVRLSNATVPKLPKATAAIESQSERMGSLETVLLTLKPDISSLKAEIAARDQMPEIFVLETI